MPCLANLELTDVLALGSTLRAAGSEANGVIEAADQMVSRLFDSLTDSEGERACVLVRMYVPQRYEQLDDELRAFAASLAVAPLLSPDTCCLTLVATRGELPAWSSVRSSLGHRAIPLPDMHSMERVPMIAEMLRQFGVPVDALLRADAEIIAGLQARPCTLFLVPVAAGSPFIPAQDDFVVARGIRSVLAFGGMLPAGELFAAVLFSRAPLSPDVADRFTPLSLSVKLGLLAWSGERIFS